MVGNQEGKESDLGAATFFSQILSYDVDSFRVTTKPNQLAIGGPYCRSMEASVDDLPYVPSGNK